MNPVKRKNDLCGLMFLLEDSLADWAAINARQVFAWHKPRLQGSVAICVRVRETRNPLHPIRQHSLNESVEELRALLANPTVALSKYYSIPSGLAQ